MYNRPSLTSQAKMDTKNSFEFHTWMIARLIETSGSDRVHLSHYVIAVCYEKMITRMTYRVSKSFRNALKNLPPVFEIPKQFPQSNASNSNDRKFILYLREVEKCLRLHTSIDNLVKHQNDLYNQETYADFHSILCELLELFLRSLTELKVKHQKLGGKAPSLMQLNNAKEKIKFIGVVGALLRLLVKSEAIKRCLYSIVGFLPDRAAGLKANDDDDDDERDRHDKEDGLYRDDEEEGEGDDELDSMGQSSASIKLEPKSQACLKSLNLAIVYIDAILLLSHFVKDQKSKSIDVKIDIQILLLPCPSKDMPMLPWKTLLQNEMYFPGKPSPSTKEIVEFLDSQVSSTGNQRSSQNTTDSQKLNNLPSPEFVAEKVADLQCNLDCTIFNTKIDQAIDSLTMMQYGDVAASLKSSMASGCTQTNRIRLVTSITLSKCLGPWETILGWKGCCGKACP